MNRIVRRSTNNYIGPAHGSDNKMAGMLSDIYRRLKVSSFLRQESGPTAPSIRLKQSRSVPKFGERALLLILSKEDRINLLGDLEEEYVGIKAMHGAGFANVWYYRQVIRSAWPLIRKALKWGAVGALGAWVRRMLG